MKHFFLPYIIAAVLLTSCSKDNDLLEVQPSQSFDDFSYDFPNEGIIKSDIGNNAYYVLAEVLSPLVRSPGLRTLKKIDYNGSEIMNIQGNSDDELIDFSISNNAIYTLYSSFENIKIKKHDLNGSLISETLVWENSTNATFATHDRGRLTIRGNTLFVAIRPEDYSTRLFCLNANSLEINWSELIEPSQSIFGLSMTGGSYDAFEQLTHRYIVFLDLDDLGNAYVVVPALYSSNIFTHNQHFNENLSHTSENHVSLGLETDALITKVSNTGERIYTVVAGSTDPNECYGIKANNFSFFLYGRTATHTTSSGYAWNAYVGKYNSDTGSPEFIKQYDIDNSEIIYDLAETNTGNLIIVGSTGWHQNPLGYSVSGTARKLVAILDNSGNFIKEFELEPGLRHNQVRSINYNNNRIWIGGWENGPGTHTGDSDHSLVFTDAFWESYYLP